jgi:hypothetical protein
VRSEGFPRRQRMNAGSRTLNGLTIDYQLEVKGRRRYRRNLYGHPETDHRAGGVAILGKGRQDGCFIRSNRLDGIDFHASAGLECQGESAEPGRPGLNGSAGTETDVQVSRGSSCQEVAWRYFDRSWRRNRRRAGSFLRLDSRQGVGLENEGRYYPYRKTPQEDRRKRSPPGSPAVRGWSWAGSWGGCLAPSGGRGEAFPANAACVRNHLRADESSWLSSIRSSRSVPAWGPP